MTTRTWVTSFDFWRANGTDLTTPYALNIGPYAGQRTLVRTLADFAISAQVNETGTSGVFPDNWWYDVVMVVGLTFAPTTAVTPDVIGAPDANDWIFLQPCRGQQQIYDVTNLNQQIQWAPPPGRIDVQSQRKISTGVTENLWLCIGWDDASGVLNSTGGGLYTCYVGGWAHWRLLFETP